METVRINNPYDEIHTPETQTLVQQYLILRQQINQLLTPYRSEVKVLVNPKTETPLKVVHVGDTHLAHDDSDPNALPRAVKETGESGLLISHANLIDAVSGKFIHNNTVRVALDLDQQTKLAAAILSPLDRQHRFIPMTGNMCHEGWSQKTATHDPVIDMVKPETPILYTGGQVIFQSNRKTHRHLGTIEAYHNPGSGRTQLSPEGSNRARAREEPFGSPNRPDAVISAHTHMLTAGQDVQHSPIDRQDHITSYGVTGSPKGTKDNPDRFLISLGVPARSQPGDTDQGLVTIWRKNTHHDRLDCYPVAGYNRAENLYQAISLWELAAGSGNLENLLGQITASLPKPRLRLIKKECLLRDHDPAAFTEGFAPLYKTVSHKIDTPLPVAIHFMANLRVGSSSFERQRVSEVLEYIDSNPQAYYFATRRLVNEHTSFRSDRMEVLTDLADTLSQAGDSLLGIMLTDALRVKRWAKPIDDEMKKLNLDSTADWKPPGDWLYFDSKIAGTPIIMPETVSKLKVGQTDYTLYLRDKLSNFTSLLNPEHGLTRIQQVWGINADLLVGGHTEVVGWRTWMRPWGPLEIIVPGGFSEFMEKGIANRIDYPEGGQGAILFPDRKLLYSFPTVAEGQDLHQAFILQEGLKQLNLLDKTKEQLKKNH